MHPAGRALFAAQAEARRRDYGDSGGYYESDMTWMFVSALALGLLACLLCAAGAPRRAGESEEFVYVPAGEVGGRVRL